jgi:thiamine biosynthesis lipoprotein
MAWLPRAPLDEALSRRRFLGLLGLVAGAGAIGPLVKTLAPREPLRVDVTRPRLGTWVRVVARHRDAALASRAVERAFAAIDRVDREMSIHRPDSDLARVNRASGHAATRVPPAVLDVVELAREGARRSDGLYDPTGLPLFRAFGFYGPARSTYPSDREIATALERVGWRSIALDRERGTLGLGRQGAALDLGSLGKGWAVDRAVEAMRAAGITDGMVDAGGKIFAFGAPAEGAPGWSIGVYHPRTRSVDRVFLLRDAAISTSGNYEQFRVLDGRRIGHLFDARRGRPAEGRLSATVLAETAVRADLMSTAAFLVGPDRFDWPEARGVHWIG